jgi:uncharacterized membrane protein (Fun14 family)
MYPMMRLVSKILKLVGAVGLAWVLLAFLRLQSVIAIDCARVDANGQVHMVACTGFRTRARRFILFSTASLAAGFYFGRPKR